MNEGNFSSVSFIDLFAGIGGIRLGFEQAGFRCVYANEINNYAANIYKENFNYDPLGDIKNLFELSNKTNNLNNLDNINIDTIPSFNVLCAGFPCQPFSICGKMNGFQDTRGTLFFDVCRVIEKRKPEVIFLENVKGLLSHDNGNTINIILNCIKDLGYECSCELLNANDFGLPQNRERVVIVAIRNDIYIKIGKFKYGNIYNNMIKSKPLNDFLCLDEGEAEERFEWLDNDCYTLIDLNKCRNNKNGKNKSGMIFIGYVHGGNKKVDKEKEHIANQHSQSYRIYSSEGYMSSLLANDLGGRYWVYIQGKGVRKLTTKECFRIMGFPDNFKTFGIRYKILSLLGNSVCVNMVREVAKEIKKQVFI